MFIKSRLISLVIISSLILAACGNRSLASSPSITLRFVHWQDTTIDGTPWWNQIVNEFEAAHPGVTIETTYMPFSQYITTMETMTAGDELPDIFFGLYTSTFKLGEAGIAVDYSKVLPPEYFKRFYPASLSTWTTPEGAVYALPLTAQMFAIYVNPNVMDSLGLNPPETWDDLINMTPSIHNAGYTPLVFGARDGECQSFLMPLIAQNGGDTYALDHLIDPNVTWDSEPVIKALTLLQRLQKAGVFADGINSITETQSRQMAYQGRAAMMFNESSIPPLIPLEAPTEYANSYYLAKFPALTKGAVHWSGSGSGEGLIVNNKSPNRDLAIEFVKYLLSDKVYSIYIGGSQYLPSMSSGVNALNNKAIQNLAKWAETDGTYTALTGEGSSDAVENVCTAVLDGSLTPEKGAAEIQKDVLAVRTRP